MNRKHIKGALWTAVIGILIGIVWQRSHRLQKETSAKRKTTQLEQEQGKPQLGDILLFYRPKLLRDIFIQAVTGSRFYHVAFYNGERDGEPIVLEARPKGVIISDLKGREARYIIVPAPEGKGAEALAWAKTQLGSEYDFRDMFVIGLEHIFTRWHINYTLPGKYTCGELVTEAFRHAGLDLVPKKDADEVAPGDIARSLAEKKYKSSIFVRLTAAKDS